MKFKKSIALLALFSIFLTGCSSKDSNKTQDIKNPTKVDSVATENNQGTDTAKDNSLETIEVSQTSEIHFIDTGNSDAILIKQGDKSALIDAGDNDDENRVVNYLKKQGIKELEYIFATHPHADHIGGLDAVVDNIKVKQVYVSNGDADTKTYRDFIESMANKGLNPSVPLINSEIS
ncbi:MAG: MBL fold metallo-hydrolase, partial [Paraclostridium sp.]